MNHPVIQDPTAPPRRKPASPAGKTGSGPAIAAAPGMTDRQPLGVRRHVMTEHHYRTERDPVGSVEIPDTALFGIHACRARENFPGTGKRFWGQRSGGKKGI